jgi:hypothetical protein
LITDTADPGGHPVRGEAPESRRQRPGSGLVDGGHASHVEDGRGHRTAADLVCARGEVFHAVQIETAG